MMSEVRLQVEIEHTVSEEVALCASADGVEWR